MRRTRKKIQVRQSAVFSAKIEMNAIFGNKKIVYSLLQNLLYMMVVWPPP